MTTSVLATDAYKFSMAQAGFPLRPETFYFSFRRGGFQTVPIDLEQHVRQIVSSMQCDESQLAYAAEHGYGFSGAMREALQDPSALQITAVPKGTWVYEREPILTVTGPSFLVSWLEPRLLWLNYPMQLATHLRLRKAEGREPDADVLTATCEEHAQIIDQIAADIGIGGLTITREDEAYSERVAVSVGELVDAVGGDTSRIFEVGMRSAVCMGQHRIALKACRDRGVTRTSNVALAQELGMTPVGTMGHEHVQRWGEDLSAFLAIRDMRTGAPSYLLDTFDTMGSGIEAALAAMRGREHTCSIRYDSGNKFIQYLHACELFHEAGLRPAHVLEDALDVEATLHFEKLRAFTDWPADRQVYGYGGFIVARPMTSPLTRDRVSAVYKLSETAGQPRMKFGNESGLGKQSVPGRPVIWRRLRGAGPLGIIGQAEERVPDNYVLLSGNEAAMDQLRLCNVADLERATQIPESDQAVIHSDGTAALVRGLSRRERA
ncbi:MAG: nicotinate phosphoribosyltransferase [Nannocystaceae bacterium]|nr:nicotinate phosphoribosyltransferase [Nannocystaceae bacterium]